MGSPATTVRRLSWALVVFAIVSAVLSVLYTLALPPFPPPPGEIEDLVQRIDAFRLIDQQAFPWLVVQSLATIGIFLIAAILGFVLRRWVASTTVRDAMVLTFVIGGILGVASAAVNLGVNNVASNGYCDCGYKNEELIAQEYALQVGWTVANWLSLVAVTLTAVGVALAGRLVAVSSAWRTLSYLIVAVILLAVVIRVAAAFVFISLFDPFQVSDLLTALAAGILVPIWAVMLARGIGDDPEAGGDYTAATAS